MKSIHTLIASVAAVLSVSASAATISCLDKNQDQFICTQVIDLKKLDYINCLEPIGDGFEARLCQNITLISETGAKVSFDCLKYGKATNDPYLIDRCSKLPNPSTVVKTNCWGELEDGYQVNLCSEVNTNEQESVHKKLAQPK